MWTSSSSLFSSSISSTLCSLIDFGRVFSLISNAKGFGTVTPYRPFFSLPEISCFDNLVGKVSVPTDLVLRECNILVPFFSSSARFKSSLSSESYLDLERANVSLVVGDLLPDNSPSSLFILY